MSFILNLRAALTLIIYIKTGRGMMCRVWRAELLQFIVWNYRKIVNCSQKSCQSLHLQYKTSGVLPLYFQKYLRIELTTRLHRLLICPRESFLLCVRDLTRSLQLLEWFSTHKTFCTLMIKQHNKSIESLQMGFAVAGVWFSLWVQEVLASIPVGLAEWLLLGVLLMMWEIRYNKKQFQNQPAFIWVNNTNLILAIFSTTVWNNSPLLSACICI